MSEQTSREFSVYTDIINSIQIVIRSWWVIAIVIVLGTLATYIALETRTRIYESRGTLIVSPQITPGNEDEMLRVIETVRYNLVGTYIQILRSRTVREAAIDVLSETYASSVLSEAIIQILPIDNSSVIAIEVRTTDPDAAKAVVDEISRQAIENNPSLYELNLYYPLQVLDDGSFSREPVAPRTELGLLLGIAASLAIGIGLAFARDHFLRTRTISESQK